MDYKCTIDLEMELVLSCTSYSVVGVLAAFINSIRLFLSTTYSGVSKITAGYHVLPPWHTVTWLPAGTDVGEQVGLV